ncbi:hypothetical protein TCAL_16804 [Tigriopus californicus]|uniref:Resolvase HTH domain-containing protein n=1 Tax=Tigriopus californicus TaxID=6832 RepID=A0A553P9W4_TIGCA|nr:hypothetical protein TCAL_16804 [Tigriopus californicus]
MASLVLPHNEKKTLSYPIIKVLREMQEAQRQRVADLLRAQAPVSTIIEVTGVSKATIYRVKNRLNDSGDLKHASRGSPVNKKLTPPKLKQIQRAF